MSFAPQFTDTAILWTSTRNRYGDYVQGSSASVSCWFRQIDVLQRSSHAEERDADAMVWFPTGTTVSKGQLITCQGNLYQIERINEARTPYRSGVQFIKCDLKVTGQAIS